MSEVRDSVAHEFAPEARQRQHASTGDGVCLKRSRQARCFRSFAQAVRDMVRKCCEQEVGPRAVQLLRLDVVEPKTETSALLISKRHLDLPTPSIEVSDFLGRR